MSRKHLIIAAIIIAVIVVLGVVKHQANKFWWSEPASDATPVTIDVYSGDTLSIGVLPRLTNAGLVNGFWFRMYAKLSGNEEIRPGAYSIVQGTNYATILGLLHYGNQNDVSITFPEGFTIAQMGERVHATFANISIEAWATATGQFSPLESHEFIIAAQKPDDVDLEGYLFPDTYRFSTDVTAEDIVKEMIDTMEKRVKTVGLQGSAIIDGGFGFEKELNVHELLTLASIIEKEVRTPETMAMVADIFMKRLDIGMALQSDATVNYIIGGDDPSVSLADTDIDSLYNTYKYNGLTPGPISNPGLNALAAVATPAANPYYYFLTTDEGDIYYAITHDEHVANKNRYLR